MERVVPPLSSSIAELSRLFHFPTAAFSCLRVGPRPIKIPKKEYKKNQNLNRKYHEKNHDKLNEKIENQKYFTEISLKFHKISQKNQKISTSSRPRGLFLWISSSSASSTIQEISFNNNNLHHCRSKLVSEYIFSAWPVSFPSSSPSSYPSLLSGNPYAQVIFSNRLNQAFLRPGNSTFAYNASH